LDAGRGVVTAMDERQKRQIIEKAYAILDRREDDEREHQEWLARHVDRYGILDLGEAEEVEQMPPQQRSTSYQFPLTDAQLVRMIDARVEAAIRELRPEIDRACNNLADYADMGLDDLADKAKKEFGELRREFHDYVEKKLGKGNVELIRKERDVA
jgi:hypothetical protein